jgi:hypothetical protein
MDAVTERGWRDFVQLCRLALRLAIVDLIDCRLNILLTHSSHVEFGVV